jgi:hypothetical protein
MFVLTSYCASAQSTISAEDGDKYAGKVVSAFGYVFDLRRDPKTQTMYISFGGRSVLKGIILKLNDELKLGGDIQFKDLSGRFITVTGKIYMLKGKAYINGDDPETKIFVHQ